MLQCPFCLTRYADDTEACPLDGRSLLAVPAPGVYGPRWTPPAYSSASAQGQRGRAAISRSDGSSGTSSEAVAVDPLIGQTLGDRLRVLRRIGQGGMGVVYEAEHLSLRKSVAVKVLRTQHQTMAELVSRLHAEARLTAAIASEHIVHIFDVGTTPDGRPYVEMEYLCGESLAQRLGQCTALSEADTLQVAQQLASALLLAHRTGIVHRDIKPENIFLCTPESQGQPPGSPERVKVLDFGIAKAVQHGEPSDPRLTRTGAIIGTPLYMSPEQVRGEPLGPSTDVYALGVVLYECLTGSVPFCAGNSLALAAKILTEPPEPPSQRCPDRQLSPGLEQLVLRAMAADKAERYSDMEELLADLQRCASGLPPLLGQVGAGARAGSEAYPSLPPMLPLPASWRRLWRGLLLGGTLLLGVGVVAAALLYRAAKPPITTPAIAGATVPGAAPTADKKPPEPAAVARAAAGVATPAGTAAATPSPAPAAAAPGRHLQSHGGALSAGTAATPSLVPARRPARPRPPTAAGTESPAAPFAQDPLLEEQAPNPFIPSKP